MRKASLVLVFLLLVISASAMAVEGRRELGGKLGLNLSNFYGEDTDEFEIRPGLNVGGYVAIPLDRMFSVQLEFLYTMKGAKLSERFWVEELDRYLEVTVTYKLDYIQIPVLLVLHGDWDEFRPYLLAGPAVAFKVNSEVEAEFESLKIGGELDDVKDVEVSLVLGGGLAIPVGEMVLFGEGRFDVGLTRVDDNDTGDGIKNITISLDAGIGIPF